MDESGPRPYSRVEHASALSIGRRGIGNGKAPVVYLLDGNVVKEYRREVCGKIARFRKGCPQFGTGIVSEPVDGAAQVVVTLSKRSGSDCHRGEGKAARYHSPVHAFPFRLGGIWADVELTVSPFPAAFSDF